MPNIGAATFVTPTSIMSARSGHTPTSSCTNRPREDETNHVPIAPQTQRGINRPTEEEIRQIYLDCIGPLDYPDDPPASTEQHTTKIIPSVWVQQLRQGEPFGSVFQVTPDGENDVDDLKNAIKQELGNNFQGSRIDISVFNAKHEKIEKMSTTVEENTEDEPYFFELP